MGAARRLVDASTARHALVRVVEIVGAAVVYFLIAKASLQFASINASATPIWPPTGLAVALVLMRGNMLLPAILIGAFAVNATTTPVSTSAVIAVGNTLEAFLGAALVGRWAGRLSVFLSPTGVVKFAVVMMALAAPVSATIGVAALVLSGLAAVETVPSVWATWWLGDVAGAVLVAPALVLWVDGWRKHRLRVVSAEALATLAAAMLVGALALSPLSPAPTASRGALAFLVILPLLWAAVRLGPRETAAVALVCSGFAVWGVQAGTGPFIQSSVNDSFLLLVAFIASATLPSLALAAVRREDRAALAQTREELVQVQKIEALGQLTSGVIHDFNNLLTTISGGVRALDRRPDQRAEITELLLDSIERGVGLTRQLLAFARREPARTEIVDLADVLERVKGMLARAVLPAIKLDARVAADIWLVEVDRSQFELALLNLALNARDAMLDGGALSLTIENVIHDGAEHVGVRVRDTGGGMSPDVLARCFEPFYSTKPAGTGTGLGLAQVQRFAQGAGGRATIESTIGEGTLVTILLPRARGARSSSAASAG